MTFDRPLQNDMLMTIIKPKSRPEVECQYGGDLFSETGSSNMSAVHWDISLIFGVQIYFNMPKRVPSAKAEVDLQLYGCDLENVMISLLALIVLNEISQGDAKLHADGYT